MSKKARAKSILDEIAHSAKEELQIGPKPWFRMYYAEHGDTLKSIHDAWHGGSLGKHVNPASRAIAKKLASLGINIGTDGVRRWLRKSPGQW